jgi:uncharacterized membrane protein
MSDAITPWLHILAVTVWVGPQFFLFIAALPAIRTIEDRQTRARVMRMIVTRVGRHIQPDALHARHRPERHL